MLPHGKTSKCKEPGWFRLIFVDKLLQLTLTMHQVLVEQKQDVIVKQLEAVQRGYAVCLPTSDFGQSYALLQKFGILNYYYD